MSNMDFQSIIKRAEKFALTVDESLREAAFNRYVEFLMQQGGLGNVMPNKQYSSPAKAKIDIGAETKDEVTTLMQIDRTAYPKVLNASSVLDRSLHLLRIANDEYQIDGLKASQIAKVLTDNFRLRTTRQAVAQALDGAGDKVNNVSVGNGTLYRIMARGESYLDDGNEQESKQAKQTPSNRADGKSARTKRVQKTESTSTQKSTSKKQSGRPGPKVALTTLLTEGFFKTPKTISSIQTEMEANQGYRYKATDLSPALVRMLREKLISREKNSEGQYEYKSR
ncbi:MAG: hypothetical protein ABR577_02875 [Pyrinomonadaceae bacterium]